MANTYYTEYAYQTYEVSSLNRPNFIEGFPLSPYILSKFALRMRGITDT